MALFAGTPFPAETRFAARVVHKGGDKTVWLEPKKSRVLGVFDFEEGTDGFVELLAAGARGPIHADAVVFKPVKP